MRLNRYIARAGITSRRKADELIASGKVFINGQGVTELGSEVKETDEVFVDGKKITLPSFKYYLLNKPRGYTVTKEDPFAKKTIFELLPKDAALFPVGRLDRETQGLILITNDGDFAQNITHPQKKVEKEYEVETQKKVTPKELEILKKGVILEDGLAKPEVANQVGETQLKIIITEGRKRQVRRMIEKINNKVTKLKRVRIGSIFLDVQEGKFRELTEQEVKNYA